ncbi:MAG: hypothetical protein ACLFP4_07580 [Spirochaetales bacterium]
MKKLALALVLLLSATVFISARESDLYVKTLYIERVYVTTLGYRIDYRTESSLVLRSSYLPLAWFGGPGAQARLASIEDSTVPYVQVFWDETDFSHLVLYVHRNPDHQSWGNLQLTPAIEAAFRVDEPTFRF